MHAVRDSALRLASRIPLTPQGAIVAICLLQLLAIGITAKNTYALALAGGGLGMLAVLLAAGCFQRRLIRASVDYNLDRSSPPVARTGRGLLYSFSARGRNTAVLPFYRIHVTAAGRLDAGAAFSVHSSSVRCDFGTGVLALDLPLCGNLSCSVSTSLRDVLGITRLPLAETESWKSPVLPGPFGGDSIDISKAIGGEEEKSQRPSQDIERYYMREYQNGDRLRDINWKSSHRLGILITRISPDTQEKTRILTVEFRHYWKEQNLSIAALIHLDYLKSWLSAFLWIMRREHPEFRFRVLTGTGTYYLESEESLGLFDLELARLGFMGDPGCEAPLVLLAGQAAPQSEGRPAQTPSEAYIFTTPFDPALNPRLARYASSTVFQTSDDTTDAERIPLVRAAAALPLPGAWLVNRPLFASTSAGGARPGSGEFHRRPIKAVFMEA